MGEHGVMWDGRKYDAPKVEIADVCGAGDTFLASFAYKYLKTSNIDKSIAFATKAASVTVQHIGVYAPTLEEIS
jgi:sugar/nucleoside kinase (ribokinase family)